MRNARRRCVNAVAPQHFVRVLKCFAIYGLRAWHELGELIESHLDHIAVLLFIGVTRATFPYYDSLRSPLCGSTAAPSTEYDRRASER